MSAATAQDSLKEKYLQQAHQLLTRTNQTTEKPRANVEPFVHSVQPLRKTHSKRDHPLPLLDHVPLHHSNGDILRKPLDNIPRDKTAHHGGLLPEPQQLRAHPLHQALDVVRATPQFTDTSPWKSGSPYPTTSTPITTLPSHTPTRHTRHPNHTPTRLFSPPPESLGTDTSCLNCTHFEQKVKFLTEANKELKRLLVASLGNNLKLQLEQLIHEKAAMSCDLDSSLRQLADNMELVDKVSIDCDVWRSKYYASRLMIDELAGVKREVSQHLADSQRALECLLREREKLREVLVECEAIAKDHTVSAHQAVLPQSECGTVVDLAHNTRQLIQQLYGHPHSHGATQSTGGHPLTLEHTTGERLARKVLSSQDKEVLVPLKLKDSDIVRQRWRSCSPDLLLLDGGMDFHCSGCRGPLLCV